MPIEPKCISSPMRIDGTDWRVVVRQLWTGNNCTEFQWRDRERGDIAWRSYRSWPTYDFNRSDSGLPAGLIHLLERERPNFQYLLTRAE